MDVCLRSGGDVGGIHRVLVRVTHEAKGRKGRQSLASYLVSCLASTGMEELSLGGYSCSS